LLRLATDLEEFGKVEAMPVLEGKRMIMFIAKKGKSTITAKSKGKSTKPVVKIQRAQPASDDKETV
jgi:hypothetical protein